MQLDHIIDNEDYQSPRNDFNNIDLFNVCPNQINSNQTNLVKHIVSNFDSANLNVRFDSNADPMSFGDENC